MLTMLPSRHQNTSAAVGPWTTAACHYFNSLSGAHGQHGPSMPCARDSCFILVRRTFHWGLNQYSCPIRLHVTSTAAISNF